VRAFNQVPTARLKRQRRWRLVVVHSARFGVGAAFVALVVTSCASVSTDPTASTPPTVTSSAIPSVSPQPTPSATPSSVPFLAAVGPPCSAAQLEVRVGRGFSNLGNVIVYLIFTDRGISPCTLRGTPSVQLLDSHDRPLATPRVVDSSMNYVPTFPNNGVGLIPLSNQGIPPGPGYEGGVRGQASLPLQYGQQNGCSNSVTAIRVRVDGGAFTVPFTIPEPGALGCEVTSVFINPFQAAEFVP